ncbi:MULTISPECIES: ABC transporter permease [unclassified Blastococcus]
MSGMSTAVPVTVPTSSELTKRPRRRRAHDRLPATPTEKAFRWGLRLLVLLVLSFLVIPILVVVAVSFNSVNYLSFPLEGVSLHAYDRFFSDRSWVAATLLSARIALLAALIATVVGTMAAWALARSTSRIKPMVYGLLYSPVIVPIIVLAMAYYFFFVDLRAIGVWPMVAVAYAVMGVPFVLVAVSSALQHFDKELENAARTLGAGPIRTLRYVTLPRLASAIAAGAVFAFVVAFDEAVIILFVSGSGAITLPRKLWDSVRYDLDPTLAVAGTVLIVVCVGLFLLAELLNALREKRGKA